MTNTVHDAPCSICGHALKDHGAEHADTCAWIDLGYLKHVLTKQDVRRWIEARLKQHADNLRMWQEPDGFLLPTEPDPEERERTRRELRAAMFELKNMRAEFEL